MVQLSNQSAWKPWQGIVCFVVYLILLITAGAYMQSSWGMIGVVTTELMFLLVAIIITLLHKTPLKEVFPIKKIGLLEFIGLLIFAAGAILLNLVIAGISNALMPQYASDMTALNDFLMQGNYGFFTLLIMIALAPAVCEEAIMRGVLLSHFRGIKNEWLGIVAVGISFGILHLSPIKFFSTAILGGCLAYLVVKKNNILLPIIVHFINNSLSTVVLSFYKSAGVDVSNVSSTGSNSIQSLGALLVAGFMAPMLILVGVHLMKCTTVKAKVWIIGAVISGVMFLCGTGITLYSTMSTETLLNSTVSTTFGSDCQAMVLDLNVDADGEYTVVVSGVIEEGSVRFEIVNAETGEIYTGCTEDRMILISKTFYMDEGTYYVRFVPEDINSDSFIEVAIKITKE